MKRGKESPATAFFWEVAEPLMLEPDIQEGTVMGFACLRLNGEFLACPEHQSGDLIVKLPAERVRQLIDEGLGRAFAPAGRSFKEWVAVDDRDTRRWRGLLAEACVFARSRS